MYTEHIAFEDGRGADPRDIRGCKAIDGWGEREFAEALKAAGYEAAMVSGHLRGLYTMMQSDWFLDPGQDRGHEGEQDRELWGAWLMASGCVRGALEMVVGIEALLEAANHHLRRANGIR